jgi:hypothetical protein
MGAAQQAVANSVRLIRFTAFAASLKKSVMYGSSFMGKPPKSFSHLH